MKIQLGLAPDWCAAVQLVVNQKWRGGVCSIGSRWGEQNHTQQQPGSSNTRAAAASATRCLYGSSITTHTMIMFHSNMKSQHIIISNACCSLKIFGCRGAWSKTTFSNILIVPSLSALPTLDTLIDKLTKDRSIPICIILYVITNDGFYYSTSRRSSLRLIRTQPHNS